MEFARDGGFSLTGKLKIIPFLIIFQILLAHIKAFSFASRVKAKFLCSFNNQPL